MSAVGAGTVIVAKKDHPAVKCSITFATPPKFRNARSSRKLLELTTGDGSLHTDGNELLGLARVKNYNPDDENLFTIEFIGHHHWQVSHDGYVLMAVKYGEPYLPKPSYDRQKLLDDLSLLFPRSALGHRERIVSLIDEAEQERHGTMLLISAGARQEAARLANQATPIETKILTPKTLRTLTPIDGAVLLNPTGSCYAIGVILDGMACEEGDPARGARYNSAIRYVNTTKHRTLAVIVSEDGGVDFYPQLRPLVSRAEIDGVITELTEISQAAAIVLRNYNIVLDNLKGLRFYLNEAECDTINTLIEEIDIRMAEENPRAPSFVRDPFVPAPEMSEKYFRN